MNTTQSNKQSILLVNENEKVSAMMEAILENSGIPLIQADASFLALLKIKQRKPSIIIVDTTLSPMQGFDLLDEIEEMGLEYEPKIILIADRPLQPADILKYKRYGVKDIVLKPFSLENLYRRLENILMEMELQTEEQKVFARKSDHTITLNFNPNMSYCNFLNVYNALSAKKIKVEPSDTVVLDFSLVNDKNITSELIGAVFDKFHFVFPGVKNDRVHLYVKTRRSYHMFKEHPQTRYFNIHLEGILPASIN